MPDNALSITAIVLTLQAWGFSLLTWALSGPINRMELLDVRDVVWACLAVAALGTLLGLLSRQRPLGRASLGLGILIMGLLSGSMWM